jgi:hypothetical protein
MRTIERMFRHNAKCADGRQRTAVFAVNLVDSIAINDQLMRTRTASCMRLWTDQSAQRQPCPVLFRLAG